MAACSVGAMKASVGMLCGGCDPNYANNFVNGFMVLNEGNCIDLAKSCIDLLNSTTLSSITTKEAVMNITTFLAS